MKEGSKHLTQDYFTTKAGSLGKKKRHSDATQFGNDLVVFSCDSVSAHVTVDILRFGDPGQPKTVTNDPTDLNNRLTRSNLGQYLNTYPYVQLVNQSG